MDGVFFSFVYSGQLDPDCLLALTHEKFSWPLLAPKGEDVGARAKDCKDCVDAAREMRMKMVCLE